MERGKMCFLSLPTDCPGTVARGKILTGGKGLCFRSAIGNNAGKFV